jgi:hypothetical protein
MDCEKFHSVQFRGVIRHLRGTVVRCYQIQQYVHVVAHKFGGKDWCLNKAADRIDSCPYSVWLQWSAGHAVLNQYDLSKLEPWGIYGKVDPLLGEKRERNGSNALWLSLCAKSLRQVHCICVPRYGRKAPDSFDDSMTADSDHGAKKIQCNCYGM